MTKMRMLSAIASMAAGALVMTYCTYLSNSHLTRGQFGWIAAVLDAIEFPAVLVGAAVSQNIHQPEAAATYSALFLTYLLLIAAAVWLLRVLVKRRTRDTG